MISCNKLLKLVASCIDKGVMVLELAYDSTKMILKTHIVFFPNSSYILG